MEVERKEVDVLDLALVALRYWKTFIIVPLVTATIAYLVSTDRPTIYRSSATVDFLTASSEVAAFVPALDDLVAASASQLGLDRVSVSHGTKASTISAIGGDPESARANVTMLVNSIADARLGSDELRMTLARQRANSENAMKNLERAYGATASRNETGTGVMLSTLAAQMHDAEAKVATIKALLNPRQAINILEGPTLGVAEPRRNGLVAVVVWLATAMAISAFALIGFVFSMLVTPGEIARRWRKLQSVRERS